VHDEKARRHVVTNEFPISEALRSLGNPLRVHPPKAGAGRTGYFTVAVILLLMAGLTAIGIVNPPDNPPPQIVLIILMGVFCVFAVFCFGLGLYSKSYTLILFPDGLARTGEGAPEIFRWNDISEVYAYVTPLVKTYRIVAQDGRKLEIDASVKDGKQLGQTVQQTLFDRMLPVTVKAFETGETLTFGKLRLDQTFLYYKDKRLAWSEIAKMQLLYNAYTRSVQFEVRAAGSLFLPWCVVRTQDIPNLDVFKTLAERKKAFTR
jgi:hypothetical protein